MERSKKYTDDCKEITELKKKIVRIKEENEILKKVMILLAKEK